MYSKQLGFTLIELIVVIVILGILAATALPRFANLSVDARIATRQGVLGAVRSAATIAHAQALVNGATGATGTVFLEGRTVILQNGYPDDTSVGLDRALELSGVTGDAASGYTIDGNTNCTVTYTAPAAVNASPTYGGVATCN